MISKEEFVAVLNKMKQQRDFDGKFYDLTCEAFPGCHGAIYNNSLWDICIQLLSISVGSNDDLISWWVFECDFGEKDLDISWSENGEKYTTHLDSAEKLYDFIVSGHSLK